MLRRMVRLLISVAIRLAANAVGIIVATVFLSGMSINAAGFLTAIVIFTVVQLVADPLMTKISLTHVPVLRGGVALVTVLIGLIVTVAIGDGLHISGIGTWLAATVIVWLAALVAALLIPVVFVKRRVADRRA
jgi:putative membrane protein